MYKKVIHNIDFEAKCLDGSPGLLYVHVYEGGENKSIMLFFLGRQLCINHNGGHPLELLPEISWTRGEFCALAFPHSWLDRPELKCLCELD